MLRRVFFTGLLTIPLVSVASVALATSLSVSSPNTQVKLLELYTSEGCSSCPPADRFVSKLKHDPNLWKTFIPVAFHVDYWDYIGWPDRFASPAFTARQHEYAALQSMRVVYTPGFFLNGKEWRWRRRGLDEETATERAGVLSLRVEGQQAAVEFEDPPAIADYSVKVALLGFGIETEVRAGENNGRTLTHDFVVLAVKQARLKRSDGRYLGAVSIPETDIDADRYALVAWVDRSDDQSPVQAVGGFL